jgi:hypothetical protein
MQTKDHIGVDSEDWDDVLRKVETSYGFKFEENELAHVRTLGDLLDAIELKVVGTDMDDCTSQQAFYRIRAAFAEEITLDTTALNPGTELEGLVPRPNRRAVVSAIEKRIGAPLQVLTIKRWVGVTLVVLVLSSLLSFVWDSRTALKGLALSAGAIWLALSTSKEFNVRTVGELAERMSQRAYRPMRRDPSTVNRKEIRAKLKALFKEELGLEPDELRDSIAIVP